MGKHKNIVYAKHILTIHLPSGPSLQQGGIPILQPLSLLSVINVRHFTFKTHYMLLSIIRLQHLPCSIITIMKNKELQWI